MLNYPAFYEDPSQLASGRMPERAHFYPYASAEQAQRYDRAASSRVIMLNGEWAFAYTQSPLYTPEGFFACDFDDCDFSPITVPLQWQFAGYGTPHYTDLLFPFPVDPPHPPTLNPTGHYRKWFDLAPSQAQLCTSVRFEGVESAFELWVNGVYIGYSKGSRMPAEFDLTGHVHAGRNLLAVRVMQYSDASYLEDQDMWWLGGIMRDVYLLLRPQTRLSDVVIHADYDADTGRSQLKIQPQIHPGAQVTCTLQDGEHVIWTHTQHSDLQITAQFDGLLPWTAETPKLYLLLLHVLGEDGATVTEVIPQRIGFRRIEIKDGEMRLNGRRIHMRGVNRHAFHPQRGRAVNDEDMQKDVRMIKAAHINAVRTSHYPDHPHFYDLCDEYGLYIIDEADLETHGFEPLNRADELANDARWRSAYLDRARRLVARDRNRACVVMWSLGNESGYGENFAAMYRLIKQMDVRPVMYEGDHENRSVDVSSSMYTRTPRLEVLGNDDTPMPHILCEYAHAMGNGPGGLLEYRQIIEASRRIQGAFVWEWKDHGIQRLRADGRIEYCYGGDFGDIPNNGNFVLDGLLMPDGTPTPGYYEYQKICQPVRFGRWDTDTGTLRIDNHYTFTNLEGLVLRAQVYTGVKAGEMQEYMLPGVAPGASVDLPLSLPDLPHGNEDCWLELSAWQGELCVGHHRITLQTYMPSLPPEHAGALNVHQRAGRLTVEGKGFSAVFDLAQAELIHYRHNDQDTQMRGWQLNLWRAPLDNDMYLVPIWREACLDRMQRNVKSFRHESMPGKVSIIFDVLLGPPAADFGVRATLAYDVYSCGAIACRLTGEFFGNPGQKQGGEEPSIPWEYPKLGALMCLPAGLSQVVYRGLGAGENYIDSCQAAQPGIYAASIDQMATRYPVPQENGNRHGTHWAVLTDEGGQGWALGGSRALDFAVRRFSDAALDAAKHDADLETDAHNVYVHMDAFNAGLGSASCGQGRLGAYQVPTTPFSWTIAIRPVDAQAEAMAAGRAMQALAQWTQEEAK